MRGLVVAVVLGGLAGASPSPGQRTEDTKGDGRTDALQSEKVDDFKKQVFLTRGDVQSDKENDDKRESPDSNNAINNDKKWGIWSWKRDNTESDQGDTDKDFVESDNLNYHDKRGGLEWNENNDDKRGQLHFIHTDKNKRIDWYWPPWKRIFKSGIQYDEKNESTDTDKDTNNDKRDFALKRDQFESDENNNDKREELYLIHTDENKNIDFYWPPWKRDVRSDEENDGKREIPDSDDAIRNDKKDIVESNHLTGETDKRDSIESQNLDKSHKKWDTWSLKGDKKESDKDDNDKRGDLHLIHTDYNKRIDWYWPPWKRHLQSDKESDKGDNDKRRHLHLIHTNENKRLDWYWPPWKRNLTSDKESDKGDNDKRGDLHLIHTDDNKRIDWYWPPWKRNLQSDKENGNKRESPEREWGASFGLAFR